MVVRADLAAAAAVARVGVRRGLAAVRLHVAVAAREAGVAGPVARPGRAGGCRDVVRRAHHAAAAAVEGIGSDRRLAAVDLLVAVTVRRFRRAGPRADPVHARPRRHPRPRADDAAAAAVVGVAGEECLAAVRLLVAVAVGEARRARPGAGAARARRRRHVVRGAGVAAAAAVRDVRARRRLAAVQLLVGVAVGEAGVAGSAADAARAGRRQDVVRRARETAAAAVVRIAREVRLAAVGQLVAVAVHPARLAGAVARARHARRRDVVGGASEAASAAVAGIGRGIGLAAVRLLVAVAVHPARLARAAARAPRARRRRHVVGGAPRAAGPAVGDVRSGVDLAAVGLLVAVAVLEPALAFAAADPLRARRGADVVARTDQAAAAAVAWVAVERGLAAVGGFAIAVLFAGLALEDALALLADGFLRALGGAASAVLRIDEDGGTLARATVFVGWATVRGVAPRGAVGGLVAKRRERAVGVRRAPLALMDRRVAGERRAAGDLAVGVGLAAGRALERLASARLPGRAGVVRRRALPAASALRVADRAARRRRAVRVGIAPAAVVEQRLVVPAAE